MKSAVLITLILCGTLLVAGPSLMDHFRDRDVAALSDAARTSFWLAGTLSILGGITGAIFGMWQDAHRK